MPSYRAFYIEDLATGRIRFTRRGLQGLSWFFAQAGIDIRSVRTVVQYREARRRAMALLPEMAAMLDLWEARADSGGE
jgi:hypothetical protein